MEVKLEAGKQLGKLIKILSEKDRGNYILTIMLKLAHDDKKEISRMIACSVMLLKTV